MTTFTISSGFTDSYSLTPEQSLTVLSSGGAAETLMDVRTESSFMVMLSVFDSPISSVTSLITEGVNPLALTFA